MYIPEFWCGVVVTVLVEVLALVACLDTKKRK